MAADFSLPFEEIEPETFAQRRQQAPNSLQLIDVREPAEVAAAALDGFENLPLSEFAAWSDTIHSRFDADKETIVMCHHGMRSAQMCAWLAQQGFTQLKNLSGGIDAYAVRVDQSVPRY